MRRTAIRGAVPAALALLLALAGCGERIEDSDVPMLQEQAGLELRQGSEARAEAAPEVRQPDTAVMGAAAEPPPLPAIDPDLQLAGEVRARFAANPDFGATKIDVHSEDGRVTLRGRAPDPAARERASDIARSVREVKSVENLLTLG